MLNDDIISIPDKWEYPWYAAWDSVYATLRPSQKARSLEEFELARANLDAGQFVNPAGSFVVLQLLW
jgi:hypothetical protein